MLAVLLQGLVWLVIEVAIPFLAVVLFGTIRGMLACVVNDRHQCQGHLMPGRFRAVQVQGERDLLQVSRYVPI